MKEKSVTFEVAKLARKKDFPQNLFNTSWYNELGHINGRTDLNKKGESFTQAYPDEESRYGIAIKLEHQREFKLDSYSAPTQSLLQKWLREKHSTHIEILLEEDAPYDKFYYGVMVVGKYFALSYDDNRFNTYEEALEASLLEALNLIDKPINKSEVLKQEAEK